MVKHLQPLIVCLTLVLSLAGFATLPAVGPDVQSPHGAVVLRAPSVAPEVQPPSGGTAVTGGAAAWFERHRHRPTMLRAFLQHMPKGGDIHTHLSGAVYAESYIDWAAQEGLCVVHATRAIKKCEDKKLNVEESRISDAIKDKDKAVYNAIVDALSTRNLAFVSRSGHDQFFAAFDKFPSRGARRQPHRFT